MGDVIVRQVESFIRRHDFIRPGARVLAAVSGGADSVALLYLLKELQRPLRLRLTVAHLNHAIRGRAAAADALFVKQLARRLRLDCVSGRADVPRLAARRGVSLEMAGRRARYDFFKKTARARNCALVATAHTADDNAETILLMLARGCGLQGLAGIPPLSRTGKITVVRPLLETSRRAIEKYLCARKIHWRDDASNADLSFLRNRVRHELLPFLEKNYNKNIRQVLGRLGDVLRNENECLLEMAGAVYSESRLENGRVINCAVLAERHPALRRRVLRQWLSDRGVKPEVIDYRIINAVDNLLVLSGRNRSVNLAGGATARRSYGRLEIETPETNPSAGYRLEIKVPGRNVLPGAGLRVDAGTGPGVCRARAVFGEFPVRASFSLKKRGRRRIFARPWRPGDRMRPYGLDGSKKIQDIFSDAKVPPALRRRLPVFECGKEIIWLPGFRIAEGWQVPPGAAGNALHLTVARPDQFPETPESRGISANL